MANEPFSSQEISQMLTQLFDRQVTVVEARGAVASATMPGAFGSFAADTGEVKALLVCDLQAAANIGAALALVPAGMAKETVRSGKLTDNLLENLHEVINVLGRIFNSPGLPHLKLKSVQRLPATLSDEEKALLKTPKKRRDFSVTISGYETGKMFLFMAL